jgi:SET domain-containing protein
MVNVQSYLSPKTKVKNSRVHGRGLFAVRPICKNEIVGIKGGHVVDLKTLKKHRALIGDAYLQISDKFFLAPLKKEEVLKVMMFINHSCEPNMGLCGEITFVAMRDIKMGEELTGDYAMAGTYGDKMLCHCGKKNCRGAITQHDWQNEDIQKKYRGYFSRYIQDKIDAIKKC